MLSYRASSRGRNTQFFLRWLLATYTALTMTFAVKAQADSRAWSFWQENSVRAYLLVQPVDETSYRLALCPRANFDEICQPLGGKEFYERSEIVDWLRWPSPSFAFEILGAELTVSPSRLHWLRMKLCRSQNDCAFLRDQAGVPLREFLAPPQQELVLRDSVGREMARAAWVQNGAKVKWQLLPLDSQKATSGADECSASEGLSYQWPADMALESLYQLERALLETGDAVEVASWGLALYPMGRPLFSATRWLSWKFLPGNLLRSSLLVFGVQNLSRQSWELLTSLDRKQKRRLRRITRQLIDFMTNEDVESLPPSGSPDELRAAACRALALTRAFIEGNP